MLRIITGEFKGRRLKTPDGIRPTEDRIRKSLFDIIDPGNGAFLELFAGSGSVGLEALSQGASRVTFVESDRSSLRALEENIRELGAAGKTEVMPGDAEAAVRFLAKNGRKFDFIFLDPPYYKGTPEKVLQLLGGCDILQTSGLVMIQHHRKDKLSEAAGGLAVCRQARYGDSLLSFFRKSGQNEQKSDISGYV